MRRFYWSTINGCAVLCHLTGLTACLRNCPQIVASRRQARSLHDVSARPSYPAADSGGLERRELASGRLVRARRLPAAQTHSGSAYSARTGHCRCECVWLTRPRRRGFSDGAQVELYATPVSGTKISRLQFG